MHFSHHLLHISGKSSYLQRKLVLFTSKYDVNNSFWHVALLNYIASGK